MKKISRILVVMLVFVLVMNSLLKPQQIHAATANQVSKLETAIEKKFSITITLSSQLSKDKPIVPMKKSM